MKPTLGTLAPPIAVLTTAIGLGYGYLDPPPAPAAHRPIRVEITDAMLDPKLEALPERNPFRLAREADPKPEAFASVPPARPKTAFPPRKLDALASWFRRWSDSLRERAEASRLVQADLRAKLDGKANLSATSIHGGRKHAILNGRAYAEGEAIDWATGLAGPIVVAEVRAASVLLRSQGAEHEVLFPHHSRPTAPPPAVAAATSKKAKGAGKTAGSPATKPR